MQNHEPVKYILYARKSSESEDRQMASIGDQIDVMKQFAKDRNLVIHDVIQESHSAKAPGKRIGFQELTTRLKQGEANGILCWKLNRLARNPVDGGEISWLLQNRIIEHIQTYTSNFKPTDNVLMMQVEFGIANQYVNDLRVDVKRGMLRKALRGWFPAARLPYGYIHNPSFKVGVDDEILPHPEQFPIIKSLWKKFLTGNHTVPQLKQEADSLGLVSPKGKPLVISTFYHFFNNPFYYGEFKWKNEQGEVITMQGKHKAMVSRADHLLAQSILGNQGRVIGVKKHDFPFQGMIKCGECTGAITAEQKIQARCTSCKKKFSIKTSTICKRCNLDLSQMDNPIIKTYTYYRCTKKKGPCTQSYLSDRELEKLILEKFETFQLPQAIYDLLKQIILEGNLGNKSEDERSVIAKINTKIQDLEDRKERFIDLRADGELTKDEYLKRAKLITEKLAKLKNMQAYYREAHTRWQKESVASIDMAVRVKELLKHGNQEDQRAILNLFGSNPKILNKSLYFATESPLLAFRSLVEEVFPQSAWLEPLEMAQPSPYLHEKSPFQGLIPILRPYGESNSDFQDENLAS